MFPPAVLTCEGQELQGDYKQKETAENDFVILVKNIGFVVVEVKDTQMYAAGLTV